MKDLLRKYTPQYIRSIRADYIYNNRKKKLLKLIEDNFVEGSDEYNKYKKEIEYVLSNRDARVFPYDFSKEYQNINVECMYDEKRKMKYIFHCGKKLFFPKGMSEKIIKKTYLGLIEEQDLRSPHRYFSEKVESLINGAVLFDVGAAEGIISLEYIDKVSKLYLFEADEKWIDALEATFEPWKDKVVIVKRFVSDRSEGENVMLDDYFDFENETVIVKMDVEGSEQHVMDGAKKFIDYHNSVIICCTYHFQSDYNNIIPAFNKHFESIEISKGYMLFSIDGRYEYPFFRRGVVRGYGKKITRGK